MVSGVCRRPDGARRALPPWPGEEPRQLASRLDSECDLLLKNGLLPTDLVTRNGRVAQAALRAWTPAFTHGALQIDHVFVEGG